MPKYQDMWRSILHTFLTGCLVFAAVTIALIVSLSLLLGSLPTDIRIPDTLNPGFLQIMWQDNPSAMLKLVLVEKPLLVIEHFDQKSGMQVWGIFYFSITLLVYLLVSALTAWQWQRLVSCTMGQRLQFALGAFAMIIGVTYLRRAACCSGGANWILETGLLAKVSDPHPGLINWMSVYEGIHSLLPLLQTGVILGGVASLYYWLRKTRQSLL